MQYQASGVTPRRACIYDPIQMRALVNRRWRDASVGYTAHRTLTGYGHIFTCYYGCDAGQTHTISLQRTFIWVQYGSKTAINSCMVWSGVYRSAMVAPPVERIREPKNPVKKRNASVSMHLAGMGSDHGVAS